MLLIFFTIPLRASEKLDDVVVYISTPAWWKTGLRMKFRVKIGSALGKITVKTGQGCRRGENYQTGKNHKEWKSEKLRRKVLSQVAENLCCIFTYKAMYVYVLGDISLPAQFVCYFEQKRLNWWIVWFSAGYSRRHGDRICQRWSRYQESAS